MESKGFEPLRQDYCLHDFQSCSFGQLGQLSEYPVYFVNSASRTRTYDIMINSHALLPTELLRNIEKRGNVLPSQGETPNYYRR